MLTSAPPRTAPRTDSGCPAPASTGTGTSGFYRNDLDGLRGIAIALVAVFHVWFGRVSGGVDVFLALSGFFFGGRLLRAALTSTASLAPVPEVRRLIRRLFPALVVVLTACAGLTILVQPETRWETFADQSLASLGYYQNWELSSTASNYLRAGEAVSPLQHIWSMSVQGQFYIAFLLLVFGMAFLLRGLLLGRHLRVLLIVLLSALTTASFVYAIVAHQADQTTAYYNSFARAWELLLGALAGALVHHVRWPMWLRTVVSVVALAAILSCGAFIDGVAEFPGPWALVPVGATILLILSAANRAADPHLARTNGRMPLPNRLLATKPFVSLGAMAYSLYLWHWPLLIFWLAYSGHTQANLAEGAGVLLVSGVLAWLTTRYIEDPLRLRATSSAKKAKATVPLGTRLRRPTIVLGLVVTLLGGALTAASVTWREHIAVQRANGEELAGLSPRDYPGARALIDHAKVPKLPMRPTVLEAKDDLPQSTTDNCISDFADPSLRECAFGSKTATRTIAVAGGSHAEHWITALDLLGRLYGFKVVTYLKMGCPLSAERAPRIPGSGELYPQCFDWVQAAMREIVSDRPDFVFTTVTRPRDAQPGDVMPDVYLPIWQAFAESGVKVLGMRDTPWLVRNGEPFFPSDCLADGGDATTCGMPRALVLDDVNPAADLTKRFPMMGMIDMSNALCRDDYCRAAEGNILIYRDSHHLSATYVRSMAPELGRRIGALTGWWP
ncbi:acyltransferase family protein [Mycolicibacterium vanbaalenii]|uniref:Acyltransferase 3 n=1 Tax=Mycolicibacterium vanbaalenii (strain DSM 7251 / JCM 13017 / BCRC 16820 / KCTC 9966 / NRRL B-24157 / PYR-1) TaxID=350058 RepID=A1TBD6_MYCVP|nr:acyltransferase family protein [Mycolicibacterium vanbaalenii]ABM14486.1 acyltransferase 3 [Mycolicibacterium vanbaalenii PYR-1]MCV7131293.1 acyltransferase [Mycolicibacterium vanbaalenii PYR-1]